MCILSYIPANTPITKQAMEHLLNGGLNNPDGHGFAIADPKTAQIIWGHSLTIEEALEEFIEMRELYPEGPALFHSRWATHGSVKIDNCHPFQVDGSAKTVLAHNGILPKDAHPEKGDDRSDTKILAEDLLPKWYSRLDNRRTRQNLARWAGSGNKLVILTVDPKYRRNIYLVNENAGQWDHGTGIWHSNGDYKDAWRKWYGTTKKDTNYTYNWGYGAATKSNNYGIRDLKPVTPMYNDAGQEICWICEKGQVNEVTRYCNNTWCDSCNECGDEVRYCMCLTPTYSEVSAAFQADQTKAITVGMGVATETSDDSCKVLALATRTTTEDTSPHRFIEPDEDDRRPYWHTTKSWNWD
jgi:glutamine amidotransferase